MYKTKEWFGEWFDSPYYHVLYKHRNEDEAKALHTLKAELIEAVGEKEGSLIARNIYHNGYKQEMKLTGIEE